MNKSVHWVQEQSQLILQVLSLHVELQLHQDPCGKSIQGERFLILNTSTPRVFMFMQDPSEVKSKQWRM
jgi:hypothetical protein